MRVTNARSERGSVLILVAMSMTLMMGLSALAIDLGYARQRSTQAQSSADFGALAGAGILKTGTDLEAKIAARDYISKNGLDGDLAEVHVPPISGSRVGDVSCTQVKASEQFPTFFGGIFNIDSITVRSQATACASPGLGGPYAIFAGSTTCSPGVSFSGANRTITGGVHSNHDMKITSSGTTINGEATYLQGDAPVGNITYNPSINNPRQLDATLPYPEVFIIEDYAPGGDKAKLAEAQLQYHNAGSATINEAWLTQKLLFNPVTKVIAPGLYYTSGDIKLNGAGYTAPSSTFVTSHGNIDMNGNNFIFSPWDLDGLLFFSNKLESSCSSGQAVIKVNGNNHSWTGVMFAPRGPVDFSGTSIVASLNGRIVAQTVSLSGSSQTIARNLAYPGRTDGFELVE